MAEHIKIRRAEGTWTVRAGGAILGETRDALELYEGDYQPVIYFPRGDLAMAFLEPTDSSTRCPHKGTATYFTISTMGEELSDAAWSYEDPLSDVAEIKDHIAFYTDRVTVERL